MTNLARIAYVFRMLILVAALALTAFNLLPAGAVSADVAPVQGGCADCGCNTGSLDCCRLSSGAICLSHSTE